MTVCLEYLEKIGEQPDAYDPLEEGLDLARRGLVERALERLSQAIAQDPHNATAYQVRGQCYLRLEEYEKAMADLDRAIKLDPEDGFTYALRADVLHDLNRNREATEEARHAVQRNPDFSYAWQVLAKVTQALANYQEAAEAYSNAIEQLRAQLGEDAIEKRYKDVLSFYYCQWGICLKQLGAFEEAHQHFQHAVKLNPANQTARAELQDFDRP